MEQPETFAERLDQAMKAKGVKRADLEDIAKRSTVSEWFTQGSMPMGTTVVRLAERLDVNAGWLLTGEGSREPENVGGMLRRLAGELAKQNEPADLAALLAEEARAARARAEAFQAATRAVEAEARAAEQRIALLRSCRDSGTGDTVEDLPALPMRQPSDNPGRAAHEGHGTTERRRRGPGPSGE